MMGVGMDEITTAQMRAIEAAAIGSGAVTGRTLMDRAGAGVVAALLAEWPVLAQGPQRALILCGPGNNGGDGFVIARLLAVREWQVTAFLLGEVVRLPPDARAAHAAWNALSPTLAYSADNMAHAAVTHDPGRALVVVDALFGIGLSRPLGDAVLRPWQAFIDMASNLSTVGDLFLVAVDVPSGLSDDMPAGVTLRDWLAPDDPCLTVTFHAPKPAHRAMRAAGDRIVVVDIGLPPGSF
jgi:hydroxyethylthiazole kinase-like uncharacterized protein yjeF